ncbi:hypothetical protein TMEC54S_01145 [Thauera mechernichensis]
MLLNALVNAGPRTSIPARRHTLHHGADLRSIGGRSKHLPAIGLDQHDAESVNRLQALIERVKIGNSERDGQDTAEIALLVDQPRRDDQGPFTIRAATYGIANEHILTAVLKIPEVVAIRQ